MTLIPALRRQKQMDLCEFKASLVYKETPRTARAVTQRNPVLKTHIKRVVDGMGQRAEGKVLCDDGDLGSDL